MKRLVDNRTLYVESADRTQMFSTMLDMTADTKSPLEIDALMGAMAAE